jgi:putative DNA primase/helicase
MKNVNDELTESSNEGDNNQKIFSITPDFDLNKLSIDASNNKEPEKKRNQNIENFKTPMRKEVEKNAELNIILNGIEELDFQEIKYANEFFRLNNKLKNAPDYEKESIKEEIKNMPVDLEEEIVIIIEYLLLKSEENGFSLGYYNGQIFIFNGKYWKRIGYEPLILEFLVMISEKSGLPPYLVRQNQVKTKMFEQFISTCSLPEISNDESEIKINFNNGTFIFMNGESFLQEFRKDDYLFYCLKFDYEPNAKAELWQTFLDRVLPDPLCQSVLLEFIGYIFLKLPLSKGLILLGSGANGKSVVNSVVEKIVSPENMCGFTLQKLCDSNGYTRAVLVGKLVNYSDEIGNGKYDRDMWKKLISGGQIEARLPYQRPFMLNCTCRFIFNANTLPLAESTHGFFRRMIIIPFNVTISEEEQDIELADKICSTNLPGIFNLVLEGMIRLVKNKRFTQSPIIDSAINKYKKESDSVSMFIEDEHWIISTENSYRLKEFYQLYKEYCTDNGYHLCSSRTFSDRLKSLGFKVLPGTNHYYYVWCIKKI